MRLLEAFWTRFGVNETTLAGWPPHRVKDYITVLIQEGEVSREKQNEKTPGSGARPLAAGGNGEVSSADMAEMAYQAMKSGPPSGTEGPPQLEPGVGPHPSAAVREQRAKLFE